MIARSICRGGRARGRQRRSRRVTPMARPEAVPGHGLLLVLGEGADERLEGVALGEIIGVVTDLPPRVLGGGDIEIVRWPGPARAVCSRPLGRGCRHRARMCGRP